MCGIAGIISLVGKSVNRYTLECMKTAIGHRGPDACGVWIHTDKSVGLAHTRLKVVDLNDSANQPFISNCQKVVLTFNGEIYNYRELRSTLVTLGHTFRTTSDTEVIIESYLEWGELAFEKFEGMFAFGLWDDRLGKFYGVRDRLGERPFLYYRGAEFIAFASEYKALLSLMEVQIEPNIEATLSFLADPSMFTLDYDEKTPFRGVDNLIPGTFLSVGQVGRVTMVRYHEFKGRSTQSIAYGDAVDELERLLLNSVSKRFSANVEVGSCLSGGLDSSVIVSMASKSGFSDSLRTIGGSFPGSPQDEVDYQLQVANDCGVAHNIIDITAENLDADFEKFWWANECPTDSPSQYAQYAVFKHAKSIGIDVLVDGQGADELLAGYEQYFENYLNGKDDQERAKVSRRYPINLKRPNRGSESTNIDLKGVLARTFSLGSQFRYSLIKQLDTTDEPNSRFHEALGPKLDQDLTRGFLSTLLRYGDRNSLANAVEVRLPFTDYSVIDFVRSLPDEYLMGEAQTKRILRDVSSRWVPNSITKRYRKQGFMPPTHLWLKGGLGNILQDVMASGVFNKYECWNERWTRNALDRFKRGNHHLSATLWKILMIETWEDYFIKRIRKIPHPTII